jgi:hypothetical protein
MLGLVILAVLLVASVLYYRSLPDVVPNGLYKLTTKSGQHSYVSLKEMIADKDLCDCKSDCFENKFVDVTKYEPGFVMFFITNENQDFVPATYKEENDVPISLASKIYFYTPSSGPYAGALHTKMYTRLCYYKNLATGDYEPLQMGGPIYTYNKLLKKISGSDGSSMSFQSAL